MDIVVPDSERISCEELWEFLGTVPEVRGCFNNCNKTCAEATKKVICASKKLRLANNNLRVLK
jgi:hypothetical protein